MDKEELLTILHATPVLQIRTAFKAAEKLRSKIKDAIHQEFKQEFNIDFVEVPELIGGIELMAHGQKISWNIADYLSSLQRR